MSDKEVAEEQTGFFDYVSEEPKKETTPEPKEEDKEEPKEEEPVKEESEEGNPEPKEEEEGGEEEEKPWKAKKKAETPSWAKKRFKEYSTTVRDLKQQNVELMETVKQFLNKDKPKDKELKREDFPDDSSFLEYKADQKVQQRLSEMEKKNQEESKAQEEIRSLREADERNVRAAAKDLPDYAEALQNGDPDIVLPQNVVNHLAVSPAGPYVKYRLATDEALAESIKNATPQEKVSLVSEIHDSTLDFLMKRQKAGTNEERAPEAPPNASKKRAPPKAPPKVKSGTTKDLLSLSGDEYVRARNEMKRR